MLRPRLRIFNSESLALPKNSKIIHDASDRYIFVTLKKIIVFDEFVKIETTCFENSNALLGCTVVLFLAEMYIARKNVPVI